jgi:hypothetical protein
MIGRLTGRAANGDPAKVDAERIDDEALRAVLHGLDLEVGSPRLVGATPNLWADELMTSV